MNRGISKQTANRIQNKEFCTTCWKKINPLSNKGHMKTCEYSNKNIKLENAIFDVAMRNFNKQHGKPTY